MIIAQWHSSKPLSLSDLVKLDLPSFTAIGVWAYLTAVDQPTTIKQLKKVSKFEHESEIGMALADLIDAGLVEEKIRESDDFSSSSNQN